MKSDRNRKSIPGLAIKNAARDLNLDKDWYNLYEKENLLAKKKKIASQKSAWMKSLENFRSNSTNNETKKSATDIFFKISGCTQEKYLDLSLEHPEILSQGSENILFNGLIYKYYPELLENVDCLPTNISSSAIMSCRVINYLQNKRKLDLKTFFEKKYDISTIPSEIENIMNKDLNYFSKNINCIPKKLEFLSKTEEMHIDSSNTPDDKLSLSLLIASTKYINNNLVDADKTKFFELMNPPKETKKETEKKEEKFESEVLISISDFPQLSLDNTYKEIYKAFNQSTSYDLNS